MRINTVGGGGILAWLGMTPLHLYTNTHLADIEKESLFLQAKCLKKGKNY
jgi:hypothetical protein